LRQTRAEIRDEAGSTAGDPLGPVEWRPMMKDGIRFSRATLPAASAWILEVDGRYEWPA
jgi:hypothetical protein